jgi:hypothetical protein
MEFRTKLDFSSNRQIKQYPETLTVLSGATSFGVPFSALTTGPDLTTSGVTSTINGVVSTFSGNSATTVYTWYTNSMSAASNTLSAWTLTNSGTTQYAGPVFSASSITTIDGNTIALEYSGISYDLTPIVVIDLGGGNYSGSVYTDVLQFYSASTLDFTGRTIWVDVSGITRTEKLIITNVGIGPGTVDLGIDATGMVVNQASDVRLKENIKTIDNALDRVLNLRGVTYNWKDRERGGEAQKIGLIAQEVNNVVPELIYLTPDGYMGVNYKDLPALLVEAIKELYHGHKNVLISTQTIAAEDNNIELNFNGNHESSIGGGLKVLHAVGTNKHSEIKTNENGDWVTTTPLKPVELIIPEYTPKSAIDEEFGIGSMTRDNNHLYIRCGGGWKKINLQDL